MSWLLLDDFMRTLGVPVTDGRWIDVLLGFAIGLIVGALLDWLLIRPFVDSGAYAVATTTVERAWRRLRGRG